MKMLTGNRLTLYDNIIGDGLALNDNSVCIWSHLETSLIGNDLTLKDDITWK